MAAPDTRIAHMGAWRRTEGGIGVRLDHPVGYNVTMLVADWGLDTTLTSAVIAGMLIRFSAIPDVAVVLQAGNPPALSFSAHVPTDTDAAARADKNEAEMAVQPHNEINDFYRDIIDAYTRSGGWIIDLCAAEQVRPLKDTNIVSYFRSKGGMVVSGNRIKPLIKVMAALLPRLVGNDAIVLSTNAWMRYHITFSSTPQLVARAMSIVGGGFPTMFSAPTRAAVQAALAAPWSEPLVTAIPLGAVCITHSILRAFGMLPEGWTQGEKAIASGSPTREEAVYKGCIKLKELMSNTAAISASKTMAELCASMNPACFNQ
ncbi:hypothetical protein [Shahe yuevirus-like virus 1]|uniref:Uncharacterized protein n=1 Tax=Shahe yuevirus-like virus 1 TaxID=1923457 RepID=A0A1L3KL97_9VIRU|nr:hypothetical protein [Shahe yuevirus-like virus 1]APG78142.1 hypothetical protein [Shahe yuevirus-like virus 1]